MILGLLWVYYESIAFVEQLIAANLGRFYTTPKKQLTWRVWQMYNIRKITEKIQVFAIKPSFFRQ